jgi:hypothetical protein
VIAHRVRDLCSLTSRQRVDAPHVTLELGKLPDHERNEVELAQVRSAFHEVERWLEA